MHLVKKKVNFREFILGGQDGLVNVLGLLLGIASATLNSQLVILSGIVATVAESVSMAAVAYTSSRAAKDYSLGILEEKKKETKNNKEENIRKLKNIYYDKGFRGNVLNSLVQQISSNKKLLLETLLFEEHGIDLKNVETPLKSAFIVGISTVCGSIIPLLPFFFFSVHLGIIVSLVLSGTALFLVGALKAKLSIGNWKRSGLELMIIGLVAALLGYGIGLLLKINGV